MEYRYLQREKFKNKHTHTPHTVQSFSFSQDDGLVDKKKIGKL